MSALEKRRAENFGSAPKPTVKLNIPQLQLPETTSDSAGPIEISSDAGSSGPSSPHLLGVPDIRGKLLRAQSCETNFADSEEAELMNLRISKGRSASMPSSIMRKQIEQLQGGNLDDVRLMKPNSAGRRVSFSLPDGTDPPEQESKKPLTPRMLNDTNGRVPSPLPEGSSLFEQVMQEVGAPPPRLRSPPPMIRTPSDSDTSPDSPLPPSRRGPTKSKRRSSLSKSPKR